MFWGQEHKLGGYYAYRKMTAVRNAVYHILRDKEQILRYLNPHPRACC